MSILSHLTAIYLSTWTGSFSCTIPSTKHNAWIRIGVSVNVLFHEREKRRECLREWTGHYCLTQKPDSPEDKSVIWGPLQAQLKHYSDVTAFQLHGSGTSLLVPHQATSSPSFLRYRRRLLYKAKHTFALTLKSETLFLWIKTCLVIMG